MTISLKHILQHILNEENYNDLNQFISIILEKKQELLKGDGEEEEDEEEIDEFSSAGGGGAGSIQGYTGPLGQSPNGKRSKLEKSFSASERAFGGGKRHKIKNFKILQTNGKISPKLNKNPYDYWD